MSHTRISVATYEFDQDIRTCLQSAMKMGADGVQFDLRSQLRAADYGQTACRQLLHYLDERDLKPASAYFSLRRSLFEKERLSERIEAIEAALGFAQRLNLRTLTLRLGRLPAEDEPELEQIVYPLVRDLASRANHHGVTLAFLPGGDSAARLRAFVHAIQSGPVGINADPAHWILSGQDPVKQMRELHDVIVHFDIRDAIRDGDETGEEVPVGRGAVNWDEMAAVLEEMNFRGWMNVRRSQGNQRLLDTANAVKYLQNLLPQE